MSCDEHIRLATKQKLRKKRVLKNRLKSACTHNACYNAHIKNEASFEEHSLFATSKLSIIFIATIKAQTKKEASFE